MYWRMRYCLRELGAHNLSWTEKDRYRMAICGDDVVLFFKNLNDANVAKRGIERDTSRTNGLPSPTALVVKFV